jgi:SAM-dependent methyltransferase
VKINSRYFDGSYVASNPTWDREDSSWKAEKVFSMIAEYNLNPASICEIGCGSGDVLVHLANLLPNVKMTGYDISPQASSFWHDESQSMLWQESSAGRIDFILGDFHEKNRENYDLLLMLDVFEHVPNPFQFLEDTKHHAKYFIFHIPLDLSASSVLRGEPLMHVREKVGHLHYYTKDLALTTLRDSGYEILGWRYTGASLNMPNRLLKTRLLAIFRRLAYGLNYDLGVRTLGGETLLVLAQAVARDFTHSDDL